MDEVPKEYGTESMWEKMLTDLRNKNFKTDMLFKEYGFTYVTMDILGYRMGSMNETLDKNDRKTL